jgi:class 3 adenylate cyclase
MLNAIDDAPSKEAAISDIYAHFLRASAIVFIARDRTKADRSLATMMDDLVTNALLEKLVRDADPGSALVECGGGLAVLVFTDVGEALDFAVEQRGRFETNGLPVKIGVDYGAILFFESEGGRKNLVGDPVNTASKISEDAGRPGRVSITNRAVELLPRTPSNAEPFTTTISNVSISGYWL